MSKTNRFTRTVAERLTERLVRMPNGCLEWTRSRKRNGYGQIGIDGTMVGTHRVAWELINGPIPQGMYICHTCDNPPCCDVTHLFLGGASDNNADMSAKGRNWQQKKTHCPQGHLYSDSNTVLTPQGFRRCKTCRSGAGRAASRAKTLAQSLRATA